MDLVLASEAYPGGRAVAMEIAPKIEGILRVENSPPDEEGTVAAKRGRGGQTINSQEGYGAKQTGWCWPRNGFSWSTPPRPLHQRMLSRYSSDVAATLPHPRKGKRLRSIGSCRRWRIRRSFGGRRLHSGGISRPCGDRGGRCKRSAGPQSLSAGPKLYACSGHADSPES